MDYSAHSADFDVDFDVDVVAVGVGEGHGCGAGTGDGAALGCGGDGNDDDGANGSVADFVATVESCGLGGFVFLVQRKKGARNCLLSSRIERPKGLDDEADGPERWDRQGGRPLSTAQGLP